MSLRARKPLVVAFTLGAAVVGAVMIYAFGGRDTFARHETFVLYFGDTVSGLGPGSPVDFMGVPIGSVKSVRLGSQPGGNENVPVVIELNADRLQRQLGVLEDLTNPDVLANEVRRGLRAQLQTDSYLTGGMFVELEYYAKPPAPALVAASDLPVIPTIASKAVSGREKIQNVVAWLPSYDFKTEIGQTMDFVDSLDSKLTAIPFDEYHQNVVKTLTPLAQFDGADWQRRFNNFITRLNNYHDSIALADQQFLSSSQDFIGMNQTLRQELQQADNALAQTRTQISPSDPSLAHLTHNFAALASDMANLTAKLNAAEQQPAVFSKVVAPPSK
ncbi:MAG TPA: MlaD family protein [Opitutales bacterium]|jgi:paraquat-inducible protein B|nr:MlaD family protein [Opitutales bacterium]